VHPCQSANVSDIDGTRTALCTPVSLPMCQILTVHAQPCVPLSVCQYVRYWRYTNTQPCAPLSVCQCVRYWRYTHSLVHPCQSANVSDIDGTRTALCTPVSLPMCQILAVHTQPCAPLSACQCVRYWRYTHSLVHPCLSANVSDIGGTHTALCTPVSLPMCQILAVHTQPCVPLSVCQCASGLPFSLSEHLRTATCDFRVQLLCKTSLSSVVSVRKCKVICAPSGDKFCT